MTTLIDVSKHNGNINWQAVKNDSLKIGGAILRAGYGKSVSQKDTCFEKNYSEARAAGLPIGAYRYSYAVTPEEAKLEAKAFLRVISGKQFSYPLYYDIEDAKQQKLSKAVCSDMVTAFCTLLEENGYFAGVYSYDSFFASNLEGDIPARFTAWAARVERIKPRYCKNHAMWQYSWQGRVDGIKGDVDLNECYKDFPGIITRKGLNRCKV
jgi:GH25 family lysozyme M1 (1,4-beta-N-acetylmuramidase)